MPAQGIAHATTSCSCERGSVNLAGVDTITCASEPGQLAEVHIQVDLCEQPQIQQLCTAAGHWWGIMGVLRDTACWHCQKMPSVLKLRFRECPSRAILDLLSLASHGHPAPLASLKVARPLKKMFSL